MMRQGQVGGKAADCHGAGCNRRALGTYRGLGDVPINDAAIAVLKSYLATPNPGYALLIDAPWGAGKTFFIDKHTAHKTDQSRLYVSLFGVDTPAAFDWALARALAPWMDGKAGKALEVAKQLVASTRAWGFSVDLTKVNMTQIALESLPDTLIFDDLERCTIDPKVLSGLLNRFVEHEKKRVILIAASEKVADKATFDTQKEKIIGRRVRLQADTEPALTVFLQGLPDGQGRDFLTANHDRVLLTFRSSEYNNLRLLRQSLRDCAALLDAMDPDLIARVDATRKLIATFLALAMAYLRGDINDEDLRARANPWAFVAERDGKNPRLISLTKSHPDADIQAAGGPVLPVDLGYRLIAEGHTDAAIINAALRTTPDFQDPQFQPIWMRLWRWDEEPLAEVERLIARIPEWLEDDNVKPAGAVLHVYGALRWIARNGGSAKSMQDIADDFIGHIGMLSDRKMLQPRAPDDHGEGYCWSCDDGSMLFSGYSYQIDDLDRPVIDAMRAAQDSLYEDSLPNQIAALMALLPDDPAAFAAHFKRAKGGGIFVHVPILHRLPVDDMATKLCALLERHPITAQELAETLSARRHSRILADEHPWFIEMGERMTSKAKDHSRLCGAQAKLFVDRHWLR